jgi:hypothetical protein
MCQAERSQLDAISGRTPLSDVPAVGAALASPTWRSHAWVREERRLRSCEVLIVEVYLPDRAGVPGPSSLTHRTFGQLTLGRYQT